MALTKEQLSEEKKYLEKVIKIFDENFKDEIDHFTNIEEEASTLRKHLNKNKNEMDPYEISQIRQVIERLIGSGDVVNKKHQLLNKVQKAPYFARMDFQDNIFNELLEMYIGLTSIYKKGQDKYLVYDWRSPAASMYYEAEVGEASYEAPIGTITGTIELKRQYKIEDRKLEYVFDNNITIDDELLKEALVKNTSSKMKNIVNSIQKEQNLVIRNLNDEILIINGPAGSGKTSVALHRIAFLLYRERDTVRADQIVILSPNKVFSEYISSVLPELGEDNVEYLTFNEYYIDNIKNITVAQSFSDYIKNIYEQKDILAKESCALKASFLFKEMLDNYFKKIENNIKFKNIMYKGQIALSKSDYEQLFKEGYKRFKLEERITNIINKATENIFDGGLSIYDRSKTTRGKVRQIISPQIRINTEVEKIYNSLFKDVEFVKPYIKKLGFKSTAKNICEYILNNINHTVLNYDDLIAMTYMKIFVSDINEDYDIKHLIIDEAQDYSILQYEIIKNSFKKAKLTILGDVNQAINPYLKYKDFKIVEEMFNNKKTKPFTLNNCYRNSFEISNFSNALLKLTKVRAMNRKSGLPVIYNNLSQEQIIKGVIENIEKLRAKGYNQIGIITKTTAEAKKLYLELNSEDENIHHIDFSAGDYSEGVCILSSYVSKGLEFDAVIAVNLKGNYIEESEKNLLYVVFTRALHRLIVFNEEKDLGLLNNIPTELYELKKF